MPFIKLIVLSLLISSEAHAISCDLARFLNHPRIRENAAFWEEFGAAGEMSDETFRQLLIKYDVDGAERRLVERAPDSPPPVPVGSPRFTMSRQAVKDTRFFASQRPALQRNLDEFLSYAQHGATYLRQQLLRNGGRWNYKKLEGHYHGGTAYSARLDGGVRVVFNQRENGIVEIFAVDNATTH